MVRESEPVTVQMRGMSRSNKSAGRAGRPCEGMVRLRRSTRSAGRAANDSLDTLNWPETVTHAEIKRAWFERERGADVQRIGIVVPDAAVQKIISSAVFRAADEGFPGGSVVGADAHGVDEAEGSSVDAHVLRSVAAEEKHLGSGGFAHQFETVAIHFDVGFIGIVEDGVADLVVFIRVVDVLHFGGAAGPEAVHFEIAKTPFGDAMDEGADVIARGGIGHVEAGAAPAHVVRFAVGPVGEPILMVLEPGVLEISGEGHEPDSGGEAVGADIGGGGFMPEGYGPVRFHLREIFHGAIGFKTVLPAIVDLDEGEAEGPQIFGGEGGLRGELLFAGGVGMIPGAVADGLRL